jgi:hypothetical protein
MGQYVEIRNVTKIQKPYGFTRPRDNKFAKLQRYGRCNVMRDT